MENIKSFLSIIEQLHELNSTRQLGDICHLIQKEGSCGNVECSKCPFDSSRTDGELEILNQEIKKMKLLLTME